MRLTALKDANCFGAIFKKIVYLIRISDKTLRSYMLEIQ